MQNAFFYTSPDDINGDDGDDGDDNTQQSPPSERSSCSYMQGTDSISSNSVFSGHSIQSYNHSSHSTSSTNKELSYTKRRKAIHYLQCQQARKKRIPYRIPEMDVVEVYLMSVVSSPSLTPVINIILTFHAFGEKT